jgi:predicted Zn-dependent peptidase
LDRERAVVIQEIMQAHDTPDDIVFDRFQETAFPRQPVGRSVLGTTDLIRRIPREALIAYVNDHYRASSIVLAAAGRIDHYRLVELAKGAFSSLDAGVRKAREPALYVGGDCRDNRDLEQAHIILGFTGVAYRDPDFYALSVLSVLLGGGMSSRLFQEVREKRGLVYTIYSFPASFIDSGLFGIYAGTGEKEVGELIPLVCTEMVKLTSDVTEEEVARAKAQLKSSILMSLESTSARCEHLARQLVVFGRPLAVSEVVNEVAAVDVAAIRRVARRLIEGPLTLTGLGPLANLPDYEDVASCLRR